MIKYDHKFHVGPVTRRLVRNGKVMRWYVGHAWKQTGSAGGFSEIHSYHATKTGADNTAASLRAQFQS